jgi:hypothetical protein
LCGAKRCKNLGTFELSVLDGKLAEMVSCRMYQDELSFLYSHDLIESVMRRYCRRCRAEILYAKKPKTGCIVVRLALFVGSTLLLIFFSFATTAVKISILDFYYHIFYLSTRSRLGRLCH